jgi:hypothetical protein
MFDINLHSNNSRYKYLLSLGEVPLSDLSFNRLPYIMNPFNCTLQTCSIEYAFTQYQPNIAANAVYLTIFSLFLVGQVVLAISCKSWSYSGLIVCGLILEILGYIARILIHTNPFSFPYFLMYVKLILTSFFGLSSLTHNPKIGISHALVSVPSC